ncbi:E3 ubiquitin-protein ligase ATL6-like [Telopea speciosissima]|uniref:E3 ubiquitin-protein ligase ATL6-like n=1 Tax=Telopea speciosissima TaxID=54955 RepID=UPI001CC490B2|nr:E3 ubiquitin-protein ligase ATL6-like [Telopea speciosissima]
MRNELKKQKQTHHPSFLACQNGLNYYIYFFFIFMLRSLPYAAAQSSNSSSQSPTVDDPYDYSGDFFSPSMGIALVVIIGVFFMFGFVSIFIRRCRGESITLHDGEGGMSRRGNRGLDPAVIDTFPTFAYSYVKGHKLGKGALECAVCLNEFEDEDTIRLLPKCDHVFHPQCIDAWLSKRTTCPVCRANLVPSIREPVQDIEADSDGEILEPGEAGSQQVSINLTSEEPQVVPVTVAPEVINRSPIQNRPARTKPPRPRYVGRFPRSNSTGHSLVQPGEDVERFTLRLPDEVRKQIMGMRQLNRTRSMVSLRRVGSSRKGYRATGEGSSRGGKSMGEKPEGWVFSMTPPFFMRAPSPKSSKMTVEGDAPVTPPRPKPFRSPLRVFTKINGTGSSSTRPPV